MKELYLLLLKKYKLWIIIIYIFFSLIGIYLQYVMNVLSLSSILVIILAHFFVCTHGLMAHLLMFYL